MVSVGYYQIISFPLMASTNTCAKLLFASPPYLFVKYDVFFSYYISVVILFQCICAKVDATITVLPNPHKKWWATCPRSLDFVYGACHVKIQRKRKLIFASSPSLHAQFDICFSYTISLAILFLMHVAVLMSLL